MYVEASHIKFLEAAGARVIPIDFTLEDEKLKEILQYINGVYIPGDQKLYIEAGKHDYTEAVQKVLQTA
jgi:gamma-glutamyl hydrolase